MPLLSFIESILHGNKKQILETKGSKNFTLKRHIIIVKCFQMELQKQLEKQTKKQMELERVLEMQMQVEIERELDKEMQMESEMKSRNYSPSIYLEIMIKTVNTLKNKKHYTRG